MRQKGVGVVIFFFFTSGERALLCRDYGLFYSLGVLVLAVEDGLWMGSEGLCCKNSSYFSGRPPPLIFC